MNRLYIFLLVLCMSFSAYAKVYQPYEVKEAIDKKDWPAAEKMLKESIDDPDQGWSIKDSYRINRWMEQVLVEQGKINQSTYYKDRAITIKKRRENEEGGSFFGFLKFLFMVVATISLFVFGKKYFEKRKDRQNIVDFKNNNLGKAIAASSLIDEILIDINLGTIPTPSKNRMQELQEMRTHALDAIQLLSSSSLDVDADSINHFFKDVREIGERYEKTF